MTVRLPLWAGPDSVRDACMCVQPPLYTTCLQKNMTILCTWDHLLFVRPPMWAGPDRIKLFVLV
jgi:hypothetical protein